MTEVRTTHLRALVEARREEIKAIVKRHHGGSVALADVRIGSPQPPAEQRERSAAALSEFVKSNGAVLDICATHCVA